VSDETLAVPADEPVGVSDGTAAVPAAEPVAVSDGTSVGDETLAVPAAVPAGEPPAVAVRHKPRRGLALGVAAALVAVVAGGGIGYAVLRHHNGAATAAPAATPWTAPTPTATKAFGAKSGGSHYGSVSLLLLPMPVGWSAGPDVRTYGNDAALDSTRAQALVRGDRTGVSAKERKQLDATLADLHIEGAGLRTYLKDSGNLVVEMDLVQMRNKEAARNEPRFFREVTKTMGVFRSGPKIAGYPQAVCVLPPAETGDKLDSMMCQATEGDLMVTMTVDGTRPLDKAAAATLLRHQLDRIKDPGEAV
jgi:hypothetical protein